MHAQAVLTLTMPPPHRRARRVPTRESPPPFAHSDAVRQRAPVLRGLRPRADEMSQVPPSHGPREPDTLSRRGAGPGALLLLPASGCSAAPFLTFVARGKRICMLAA